MSSVREMTVLQTIFRLMETEGGAAIMSFRFKDFEVKVHQSYRACIAHRMIPMENRILYSSSKEALLMGDLI